MPTVFVYGTLLSGERNNYLLEESERMGEEVISGFQMVTAGSFPALIPDENATLPILGEVWKVTDEVFQSLDMLEGYPHFYNRKEVDTFAGKAWVYYMPKLHDENPIYITSGSWKQYLKEKYGK